MNQRRRRNSSEYYVINYDGKTKTRMWVAVALTFSGLLCIAGGIAIIITGPFALPLIGFILGGGLCVIGGIMSVFFSIRSYRSYRSYSEWKLYSHNKIVITPYNPNTNTSYNSVSVDETKNLEYLQNLGNNLKLALTKLCPSEMKNEVQKICSSLVLEQNSLDQNKVNILGVTEKNAKALRNIFKQSLEVKENEDFCPLQYRDQGVFLTIEKNELALIIAKTNSIQKSSPTPSRSLNRQFNQQQDVKEDKEDNDDNEDQDKNNILDKMCKILGMDKDSLKEKIKVEADINKSNIIQIKITSGNKNLKKKIQNAFKKNGIKQIKSYENNIIKVKAGNFYGKYNEKYSNNNNKYKHKL